MKVSLKMKAVLFLSGAIAAAIGGMILIAPDVFYASYGIVLSNDPSALNETRASGGLLFALGALIIAGAFVSALTLTSSIVAVLVYLSYGLSRVVGFALDGWPNEGMVEAAVIEFAIGLIVFAVAFCGRIIARLRPSRL